MRRPTTVTVDLVADEHTWQIAPGRAVSGCVQQPGSRAHHHCGRR